jgi:hypothetical protein
MLSRAFQPESENNVELNNKHEYPACAAFNGSRVVLGKEASEFGSTIPVKSLLTYLAPIRRKRVLDDLAGGSELLIAARNGMDESMISDAIVRHLRWLYDGAQAQAASWNVRIVLVVITYPDWLHDGEKDTDFRLFIEKYTSLSRLVWGDNMRIAHINEGKALARYAWRNIADPWGAAGRAERRKALLENLNWEDGVNFVSIDFGSCTIVSNLACYFT